MMMELKGGGDSGWGLRNVYYEGGVWWSEVEGCGGGVDGVYL